MKSLTNYINESQHTVNERQNGQIEIFQQNKTIKTFLKYVGKLFAEYNYTMTFNDDDVVTIHDEKRHREVDIDIDYVKNGNSYNKCFDTNTSLSKDEKRFLDVFNDILNRYNYNVTSDKDMLTISDEKNTLMEIMDFAMSETLIAKSIS